VAQGQLEKDMITEDIKQTIEAAVPNAIVYVLDPMNDGQHLQALVISSTFEGLPLVKQHQMVMRPLKEAFVESVHALGLQTFTPAQWQEVKSKYGQ
jgi:acid stress-induced BolA-like protein IbaG/YrbA